MRIWCAALAAILLLVVPAKAHGFALCAQFGKEDAETAFELKNFIQRNTPIRDMALAERVQIEFSDNRNVFGPYVSQESPTTIRIPRGFMRLSCELVMVTANTPLLGRATAAFDDCLDDLSVMPCLHKLLPVYAPMAEKSFAALTRNRKLAVGEFPQNTIEFVLLHEFAHIRSNDFARLDASDDPDLSREIEFEADLYAARYTALAHGYPGGGGLIFTLLSGPGHVEQQEGATHDSFFCRLENINNILAATELIPAYLVIFPGDRFLAAQPDTSIIASRRAALHRIAAADHPSEARMHFSSECRIKALPQLAGVRRDLLKLAAFQDCVADSLPRPEDGDGAAAIMARLIDLPMETPDGRAARVQLLAEYADVYRPARSSRAMTDQIERTLALPDMSDARQTDMGYLQRELALRFFYFPPDGMLTRSDHDILFGNLFNAMMMSGEDPDGYAAMTRLALLMDNCELARTSLRAGFETGLPGIDPALPTALRAEIAAAGCR